MATTTVENWKLLQDGRIEGVILPDGDKITTSPLQNPGRAQPQSNVRTVSGSTYRLGRPSPQQQQQQVQRNNNNNNNNAVLQQYVESKTVSEKKQNKKNDLLTVRGG
jgi:hypothetical protein